MRNTISIHPTTGAAHVYFLNGKNNGSNVVKNDKLRAAAAFATDTRYERRTKHRRWSEERNLRETDADKNVMVERERAHDNHNDNNHDHVDNVDEYDEEEEEEEQEEEEQEEKEEQAKEVKDNNVHVEMVEEKLDQNQNEEHRQQVFLHQEPPQQQTYTHYDPPRRTHLHPNHKKCEPEHHHHPHHPDHPHQHPDSIPQEFYSRRRTSVDQDGFPIQRSSRAIRVSYTPVTYIVQLSLLALHAYTLIARPSSSIFPNFLNVINIIFHTVTLVSHISQLTSLERYCIIYGPWIIWIGWIENISVFNERASIDFTELTVILFWALMLDRRNAWGIVVWEHLTHLSLQTRNFMLAMTPLHIYHLWTLFGAGSAWGLVYLALAFLDGLSPLQVLSLGGILKVWLFNLAAGGFLTCWWSFWTFQYRGVVWRREMRKGVVVWWSEGLWGGECV